MKKSTNVAVTVVAAIGLSIACGSREQDTAARVCMDGVQRVVSADRCNGPQHHGGGGYFWYYHAAYANGRYPALGTTVHAGGSTMTQAKPRLPLAVVSAARAAAARSAHK